MSKPEARTGGSETAGDYRCVWPHPQVDKVFMDFQAYPRIVSPMLGKSGAGSYAKGLGRDAGFINLIWQPARLAASLEEKAEL